MVKFNNGPVRSSYAFNASLREDEDPLNPIIDNGNGGGDGGDNGNGSGGNGSGNGSGGGVTLNGNAYTMGSHWRFFEQVQGNVNVLLLQYRPNTSASYSTVNFFQPRPSGS